MPSVRVKLVFAILALTSAGSCLLVAGGGAGWVYYLNVDQFVERGTAPHGRVRLHGVVAPGGKARPTDLQARFELKGERCSVPVEYRGVVPATFGTGRQVVVEGAPDEHGVFQADVLLTKCASKYETQPGAEPGGAR